VCFWLCAYTHTKYLSTCCELRLLDGHLENQENPDGLKRSKNVDRVCVQSTFVYMYSLGCGF